MENLQSSFIASVNEANDYMHVKQNEIADLAANTQKQLDSVSQLDFKNLIIEEARELNHDLKEQTGLDLGNVIAELKEIDSAIADAEDAAFYAEQAAQQRAKEALCVKYSETLGDKTSRLAGFFQDWRGYQAIDPIKQLPIPEALKLYGLGKQAASGNNNEEQPSFVKIADRLMWNSWKEQKGKARTAAAKEFNVFSTSLLDRFNVKYEDPQEEPKKKEYNDCVNAKLAKGFTLE